MRAGQLRHRITIQTVDPGTDDYGAPVAIWADLYSSVPADVEPLTGKEIIAAGQTVGGTSVMVTMRYLPGITPKARILFEDQILDVKAVQDIDNRHRELQIVCEQGLTQG